METGRVSLTQLGRSRCPPSEEEQRPYLPSLLAIGDTSSGLELCGEQLRSDTERDVPLWVKYDTRTIRIDIAELLGLDETGAAIALQLHEANMTSGRRTSYSRSKMFYERGRQHRLLSYRRVIRAVDMLEAQQLIHNDRRSPGSRGWQSSMIGTSPLFEAMTDVLSRGPHPSVLRLKDTIVLRDARGGEVDLRPSRELVRRSRKVEAINEAITSSDVRSLNGVNLACPMRRIYNVSWKRGGRMYAAGISWQQLHKAERSQITINNEPVAELDFATLHPAMLYAEVGEPLPGDCYEIVGWERGLVKLALLTLINAPSEAGARLALAWNARIDDVTPGTQEAIRTASALIGDIKRVHAPIASAFHRDAGARLMRQDSDLAVSVLTALLKQGVVALPIHDSFLVPASKREALEVAMMRAAHAIGLRNIRVSLVSPLAA